MDFKLSPEDMQALQDYLDGKTDFLSSRDVLDRAFRLTEALRRRVMEDTRKAIGTEASLRGRLERARDRKKDRLPSERTVKDSDFKCLGMDSLEVILAILHCAMRESIALTREKAVLILYAVYVSWLESHKEKITIESPVADYRGPWFWRAYGRFDLSAAYGTYPKQCFENIARQNSGVAALIHNATKKYGRESERDLAAFYRNSEPYRKAAKKGPDDKWNHPLDSVEMYYWKHDLTQ